MRGRERSKPVFLVDRLEHIRPLFESTHIEEPKLVFGNGRLAVDPKAGLTDFGPYDFDQKPNQTIQIGVIGTNTGIQNFLEFLEKCSEGIRGGFNSRGKPVDPLAFPQFPGFSADQSFRVDFVSNNSAHHRPIHEDYFKKALAAVDDEKKIEGVVGLLLKELKALSEIDPPPSVVVVVLPPEVEFETAHIGVSLARKRERLSPQERFEKKLQRESAKTGQSFLELNFDDPQDRSRRDGSFFNIHHAFKARAMAYGFPTQFMWDKTLRDPMLSSVAWNVLTAIYYKAGNIPWKLQSMPDNTCFVGVSFFREKPYRGSDLQSSLAQVFGAGEGIVLRGEKAVIDPDRGDRSPHLTEHGATKLLSDAILRYTLQHGAAPSRVVVHKTSKFWPEELRGFKTGLGEIYHYDFVTLADSGNTRFMRVGNSPVLRGTMIRLAEKKYLLFTNGYVPYLRTYPSKRIPRPLEIVEHFGDSTPLTVCQDILALTKLNWNSCSFASSIPITIRFSREVGKIVAALPPRDDLNLQSKYRFFM